MIGNIDWSINGSLIDVMIKCKYVIVYDVRGNKEVLKIKCDDSTKSQKMLFIDMNYFITTGFDSGSRELKLFDMRNSSTVVNILKIDSQTGVIYPSYDYDNNFINKLFNSFRYFNFN